ncbi:tetratricopeptide repeat protein [Lacinutrix venerupis]|uniref:tetratricopeptide repeat protein n=1 Tax=Lacinutrix venerupis TaxID=1486034 RepID=UPI000EAFF698|nr:tetratricopeptide repeat protein [Lacinutrix venerupis]RLJ61451.1 tetratricopeptide repeat protein [Lacinutrix venerupis]
MQEEDYILFDAYINGELSDDEILKFQDKMDSDLEFSSNFNLYLDTTIFLQNTIRNEDETNAFKNNLNTVSENYFNKEKTTTKIVTPKRKPFNIIKYLAAACIALLVGFFVFNQFSDPTYSDFNSHEPMTIVRSENNVKELIEATKAFNNKNYDKANSLLKKILDTDPNNSELQLYYAITNIELDNFKIADTQLNKIVVGKSVYKNRALWYSALSKLKQKDIDATIVYLKQIPEEADDFKEAQDLLDKLE